MSTAREDRDPDRGRLREADHRKEAVAAYMEQTRLLVTLASAFVVVPAAARVTISRSQLPYFVVSEACLVGSVLCGYVVFATVTGWVHVGRYDVYRPATRWSSLLQIGLFLLGLIAFVLLVADAAPAGSA